MNIQEVEKKNKEEILILKNGSKRVKFYILFHLTYTTSYFNSGCAFYVNPQ